jgi:hypothetical protein
MSDRPDYFAAVRDEVNRLLRDLDSVARPHWFHRPLSTAELRDHADRERITNTIRAVVATAAARVERDLRDGAP